MTLSSGAEIAIRTIRTDRCSCTTAYGNIRPWHVVAVAVEDITCALTAIKTHRPVVFTWGIFRVMGWRVAFILGAVDNCNFLARMIAALLVNVAGIDVS